MMIGCFITICKGRGFKVNADNNELIVLGGEEGSAIENVSEFKYFNFVGKWRVGVKLPVRLDISLAWANVLNNIR